MSEERQQYEAECKALENINQRRLGKFIVSRPMLLDPVFPEFLAKMEFVPVRAELLWVTDSIEYVGFSPYFEELFENASVPTYMLNCFNDEDGNLERIEAVLE